MADEWSAWIEHDGGAPMIPDYGPVRMAWVTFGKGKTKPDRKMMSDAFPGFYWSWQETPDGGYERVCADPAYAPIIRYRFHRPAAPRQMIDMIATVPACKEARK